LAIQGARAVILITDKENNVSLIDTLRNIRLEKRTAVIIVIAFVLAVVGIGAYATFRSPTASFSEKAAKQAGEKASAGMEKWYKEHPPGSSSKTARSGATER